MEVERKDGGAEAKPFFLSQSFQHFDKPIFN
jgi:hypothetical protein